METKQVLELEYKSMGDIIEEKRTLSIAKKMLDDGRVDVNYIAYVCDMNVEDVLKLKE